MIKIDELEGRVPTSDHRALSRAHAWAEATGGDALTVSGGKVYRITPDGRRVFVKAAASPVRTKHNQPATEGR